MTVRSLGWLLVAMLPLSFDVGAAAAAPAPTQTPPAPASPACKWSTLPKVPDVRGGSQIVKTIATTDRFEALLSIVKYLRSRPRKELKPILPLLESRSIVPLKDTAKFAVEVEPRVKLGDLPVDTEALREADDLFVVGGRANWVLSEVTCVRMGVVTTATPASRLKVIEHMWSELVDDKKVGLQGGDPRLPLLGKMSRQEVSSEIADLSLLVSRMARAKSRGDAAEAKKAEETAKALAVELELLTDERFGSDAAAWDDWFQKQGPFMYFDWKMMKMRVKADPKAFFREENAIALPQ